MDYIDIIKQFQSGEPSSIYLLHGNEAYFIDEISKAATVYLDEGLRDFNLSILYGKDTDVRTLIDVCSRAPMMSPKQVVILKEAQDMKQIADLVAYAKRPIPSTILVIAHKHKKLDMRLSLGKQIKKNGIVLESKRLYDNQIAAWISQFIKKKSFKIAPEASSLLAEYLGADLGKIVAELNKLFLNMGEERLIKVDHIQKYVGISKAYNVFEFQKAIGTKNFSKAMRIADYFNGDPRKHPFVMVLSSLTNYYLKLLAYHAVKKSPESEIMSALKLSSRFFIKDYALSAKHYSRLQVNSAISILREYDMKSKGMQNHGTTNQELLKELIYKLTSLAA